MRGVPDYAAVSQAVEHAGRVAGRGSRGLANAVLRAVAADGDGPELFPRFEKEPAEHLATWGSHPRWLLDRWLRRWPPEEVAALVRADNEQPVLTLVPLEGDPGPAAAAWRAAGLSGRPVGQGTRCVAMTRGTEVPRALAAVPSFVQDPAANLVATYVDPPAGTIIADLCAAPGGKALALSGAAVYTVAGDASEARLRLIRENVRRARRPIGLVRADARFPPVRRADVVLLDVPCTGTGTLRRHPDARWRLRPERVDTLAEVQAGMLEAAAGLVVEGGLLVYATCTLEPEENRGQVCAFLDRHREFRLDSTEAVPREYLREGCLEVLPHRSGFDGAFAARMRRLR